MPIDHYNQYNDYRHSSKLYIVIIHLNNAS